MLENLGLHKDKSVEQKEAEIRKLLQSRETEWKSIETAAKLKINKLRMINKLDDYIKLVDSGLHLIKKVVPSDTVLYVPNGVQEVHESVFEDMGKHVEIIGGKDLSDIVFGDNMKIREIIINIDFSGMDDISYMFAYCKNFKRCIITGKNTSTIKDMCNLFYGCRSLEEVYFIDFDTSNVIEMSDSFANCESLKVVDVRCFDTSSVQDFTGLFRGCKSLKRVDLSSFRVAEGDTPRLKVGAMCRSMFSDTGIRSVNNPVFDKILRSQTVFKGLGLKAAYTKD